MLMPPLCQSLNVMQHSVDYLKMNNQPRNINTCDECISEYYPDTSQMTNLCPECAHVLYGYENCEHEFANERCIKCFWNGKASDYIKDLKEKQINKSEKILHVIDFFQSKYGPTNILINDHWESDREAIGLTDRSGQFLAYISTLSDKDNIYYLALENPATGNELPYSPAGEFNNLSLKELESLLTKHFKLTN